MEQSVKFGPHETDYHDDSYQQEYDDWNDGCQEW